MNANAGLVLEFVERSRRQPAQAVERLTILMESLNAQADAYGEKATALRDAASECLSSLQSARGRDAVRAPLDALEDKVHELFPQATLPAEPGG